MITNFFLLSFFKILLEMCIDGLHLVIISYYDYTKISRSNSDITCFNEFDQQKKFNFLIINIDI